MNENCQKDETLSHVELFKEIFRTALDENYDGVVPDSLIEKIHTMVLNMTKAEIRWSLYVGEGLPGFSTEAVRVFIEGQANSVCKNLKVPQLFEKATINPLRRLVVSRLKGGVNESRTNFFELRPVEYNSTGIEIDI